MTKRQLLLLDSCKVLGIPLFYWYGIIGGIVLFVLTWMYG